MQYCAKTNTADPATGFISVGEILTDEQARALGEEKLLDMTRRGVLEVIGERIPADEHAKTEPAKAESGSAEDEMPTPDADDAEDEMPTLDADDVFVGTEPKKRGGRKTQ